jgi:2-polyprenyl-6-methoxyphenol hydroxylase-like FAD-dependent oxidoreductase
MSATFRSSYDVVVVGARVAGAATAMQLARAGLKVLVIDRARYGADTVSTHALMRGGVVQLQRWSLLPDVAATGTPAVRMTTFHYGDEVIPVEIKPRDGVQALYAPRRTVLDALLADAAAEAGADMRFGVRFESLERDRDGRVTGVVIEDPHGQSVRVGAGLVIGADGIKSSVAKEAGAEDLVDALHAAGCAYGYWPGLALDGYHWHYSPGLSVGAIPTTGGDTNIFISMPMERFREEVRLDLSAGFHRALAECAPDLAARVEGVRPSEALRAFPGVRGYVRNAYGPGWALVGDAGFFRDPITAHGITDALRDSELLARAYLRSGEAGLADYQRERDPWAIDMLEVSDAIGSFDWDLESVKPMHKRLSKMMAKESQMLAGLGDVPSQGARDAVVNPAA